MAEATEALDATIEPGQEYFYRLTLRLTDGSRAVFGPISAAAVSAIRLSGLTGIMPNPASSGTRVDFALARAEKVRISVVDVAGREAALLANGMMTPGNHSMIWDAHGATTRFPAGAYFVRWESPSKLSTRRIVLTP